MNDPHVVSLTYRVMTRDNVIFKDPPPVTGEHDAFRFRLEAGVLTVEMKEHHASVESARLCVDDFLRAWELDAALTADRREFEFKFQRGQTIDRNPSSPEQAVCGVADLFIMTDSVKAQKVSPFYPPPPTNIRSSHDAETMWHHYNRYLEDRDKITSMGFYCLSLLQWRTGNRTARQAVAYQYKIDKAVLDMLATLTSDVGDLATARKLESSSQVRPHTAKEIDWIRAAIRMLIRRKAEYDYDPAVVLPQITMTDLPNL